MILNKAQAEAAYSAMVALNNVSACSGIELQFFGGDSEDPVRLNIEEDPVSGKVRVMRSMGMGKDREVYAGQLEFAAAYGIN